NNYGTWTANSGSTLEAYGSPGGTVNVFNNESGSTFTQQGAGNTLFTTSSTRVALHKARTVNVHNCPLTLHSRGNQTGTFLVATSATLVLNGTHSFSSGSSLSGSGAVTIQGGTTTYGGVEGFTLGTLNVTSGTVNFNAACSFGSMTFSGGTLGGSGNV